jgi:hypothetical protein
VRRHRTRRMQEAMLSKRCRATGATLRKPSQNLCLGQAMRPLNLRARLLGRSALRQATSPRGVPTLLPSRPIKPRASTELENIARRNPLGALAGAVAVGVLIGMMGRRSCCYSGSIFRPEWRRFVLTSENVLTSPGTTSSRRPKRERAMPFANDQRICLLQEPPVRTVIRALAETTSFSPTRTFSAIRIASPSLHRSLAPQQRPRRTVVPAVVSIVSARCCSALRSTPFVFLVAANLDGQEYL